MVDSSANVVKLSVEHYETIEKRFGPSHVVFWVEVEARDPTTDVAAAAAVGEELQVSDCFARVMPPRRA